MNRSTCLVVALAAGRGGVCRRATSSARERPKGDPPKSSAPLTLPSPPRGGEGRVRGADDLGGSPFGLSLALDVARRHTPPRPAARATTRHVERFINSSPGDCRLRAAEEGRPSLTWDYRP